MEALDAESRIPSGPGTASERDVEEGDSEYLASLLGVVNEFADWSDQPQVCILAHAAYNPDSEFGAKIAAHAKILVAKQCDKRTALARCGESSYSLNSTDRGLPRSLS